MADRDSARRLLFVWCVSVVLLTLAPFGPWRETAHRWATLQGSRLGPFDLIANLLLFVPGGVLAVRAGAPRWAAFLAALAMSFGIEWTQQWIAHRHPSSFDVAANTAGGIVGAAFSTPLLALCRRLWIKPLRACIYVAGGAVALALPLLVPQLTHLAFVFPFSVAVLGGIVGVGLWNRATAFVLAGVGVTILCARVAWPLDPLWIGACLGGAVLGVWAPTRVS